MYEIKKDVSFDYGHRVWSQTLIDNYATDCLCVCRHLHGHRGVISVHLMSDKLDHTGMVTDFKNLGWFKEFVNTFIDHRFIIDKNDPLFENILKSATFEQVHIKGTNYIAGEVVSDDFLTTLPPEQVEYFESFFIVDFVPTSENLSKWAWTIVDAKMKLIGVKVSKVVWHETPTSHSTYTG